MTWQPAAVLYPDVEMLLCQAYGPLLAAHGEDDVVVAADVPNPRPPRVVVFTRDGGTAQGLRDRPRVRVRVFDETEQAATDLARLVAALTARLPSNPAVTHSEVLSGPLRVPDPSKKPQRYLLIELHTRPTQLGATP